MSGISHGLIVDISPVNIEAFNLFVGKYFYVSVRKGIPSQLIGIGGGHVIDVSSVIYRIPDVSFENNRSSSGIGIVCHQIMVFQSVVVVDQISHRTCGVDCKIGNGFGGFRVGIHPDQIGGIVFFVRSAFHVYPVSDDLGSDNDASGHRISSFSVGMHSDIRKRDPYSAQSRGTRTSGLEIIDIVAGYVDGRCDGCGEFLTVGFVRIHYIQRTAVIGV